MGGGRRIEVSVTHIKRMLAGTARSHQRAASKLCHAKKPRKFPILAKHVSHASLTPSSNQLPPCHSAK
ncbi:hypothetical protein TNCV_3063011 [Trichonephila clavipes]|nr:hypothetical protein TNCV_3063011 [Trichonephila clavipes]